ncbi:MAG TPA: hypothetical protein VGO67_12505 [Verrucomicrobiae bacterium]|jgi:hypothetical protein
MVHLNLKPGVNNVNYTEATAHLEPDSVVLRDPTGGNELQILEQGYRADPVSVSLLMSYYEGKTIDFEVSGIENKAATRQIIRAKIIRSGAANDSVGPLFEVDGKLTFKPPGDPLFPSLPDDSILKPTLTWQLSSDKDGPVDAELSYITGGMNWHADYNVVSPEKGDTVDVVGWVTMDNESGKTFQQAKIKLMAGDVNKVQTQERRAYRMAAAVALSDAAPPVSERSFDEYHLYTMERPATLRDHETKQVEFVRAAGVKARLLYVYDGAQIDPYHFGGLNREFIRDDQNYGTQSNPKVRVVREFSNSESNHLGIALPKGRIRFYRSDADGQMEFTGENTIDHTPRDEVIRVSTGNAFDLVGERKRVNFKVDNRGHTMEESFEIKLRNHKKEATEIRVVEHLYRWDNWEITQKSDDFVKTEARTVEFRVGVATDTEKTVTYTVHYSW